MSTENKLNSKIVKFLRCKWVQTLFAIIVLTSIVFYIINIDQDFSGIFLLHNPKFFLFAIPSVLYSLIAHAMAWRLIINHFGNKFEITKSVYVYYLSNLSRYIPGNYWHIVLRSTIGVNYGVDLKTGFKGTGVELFLNAMVSFFLIILGLLLRYIKLNNEQVYWLIFFFMISIIMLLFLFINEKKLREQKNSKSQSKSIFMTIKEEIAQIWTFSFPEIMLLVFWYSSAWISQGLSFFFVLSIWGELKLSNYLIIMFSYVTAWFMGFINPLAQNGLGVREAVYVVTIGKIISLPIILGASIVMRIIGLFGEILLVICGWFILRAKPDPLTKE